MADRGTAAYVSWSKDGVIQLGINSYIVNILSDIECKSKIDLVNDLHVLDQQEEDVALARDILFKQMVCTYENTCETLGVSKEMSPILRLKDRRGENASNAIAEDVIDIYAFNCGLANDIPRNMLSANSRLPNLSDI